jgi:hypothetical protein
LTRGLARRCVDEGAYSDALSWRRCIVTPDIMGGPERDEQKTDLMGAEEVDEQATDLFGGAERDEQKTDLLGGTEG